MPASYEGRKLLTRVKEESTELGVVVARLRRAGGCLAPKSLATPKARMRTRLVRTGCGQPGGMHHRGARCKGHLRDEASDDKLRLWSTTLAERHRSIAMSENLVQLAGSCRAETVVNSPRHLPLRLPTSS